jgi:hypothetical protein
VKLFARLCRLGLVAVLFSFSAVYAQLIPQATPLGSPQLWQRLEFRLSNIPAVANPFDPDLIQVDALIRFPSGKSVSIPAFWYQGYQRALSVGSERLTASGAPEWRLRFTPTEPGSHALSLSVRVTGQPQLPVWSSTFEVPVLPAPAEQGYVQVAPSRRYFELTTGQPLRLIGANVCWHGGRGTYDYDDWFTRMQGAGENYARLWMCPWAFGLETDANSLNRYRLDRAWQLDYVFKIAEQRGIYLLLCLDYHGMFEVTPDYWGGNNFWTNNPYAAVNGGPCTNQDAFFTNAKAHSLYQKRLRYLIARYGYSPRLLAWQFFNEIDNVYSHLTPTNVAQWHGVMADWLHRQDPFGHLVTTSLTGNSDRPEIWSLPQLDFTAYHSYGEPGPASRLAAVSQSFIKRYGKPVLIDEFGTDWRGWNRENDPYLRGFRQGLWGGALGGSAGSTMSWWWEIIHQENLYPTYTAMGTLLKQTGWSKGSWTNVVFITSGQPPSTVGTALSNAGPFSVTLSLNGQWGAKPPGQLAVANPDAAGYAPGTLASFVHGTAHPDLRAPFRLSAWLTNNARLVMHLNSVSSGAALVVRSDGAQLFRTNLPNLDGGYQVNNEYNLDLSVALPSGKHLIEIANAGGDWFYLDWIRLEGVQPATYPGNWQPSPESIGLRGEREALVYVVAPGVAFPANATNSILPLRSDQSILLTNWFSGTFKTEWYDPASGARVDTTQGSATNNILELPLPPFREDLVGVIVFPPPRLSTTGFDAAGQFCWQLSSEPGGSYTLERSSNLVDWISLRTITNWEGAFSIKENPTSPPSPAFFRAKR